MKQEELFAKLLNEGLTAAELRDLKALLAESPDAAHELQQLQALEESLRDHGAPSTPQTDRFLKDIEDKAAAALQQRGPAEVAAAIGQRSFISSAVYLVGSLALILGIAGLSFMYQSNNTDETMAVETSVNTPQAVTGKQAGSQLQENSVVNNSALAENNTSAQAETQTHSSAAVETETSSTSQDNNSNAGNVISNSNSDPASYYNLEFNTDSRQSEDPEAPINLGTPSSLSATLDPPDGLERKLQTLKHKLEKSLRDGDNFNSALNARALAIFWRECGPKFSAKSREHFEQSLNLTNTPSQELIHAETLGHYALLQARNGNPGEAREMLAKCVNTLERLNSNKLNRWQTELDNLR